MNKISNINLVEGLMKETKQKQTHRDSQQIGGNQKGRGWVVGVKWVKGFKYMVVDRNQTFGAEHSMVYTDIKLLCCTSETYIMLQINKKVLPQ